MNEIIIGMSVVVLRGISLKIKFGLVFFFYQTSTQIISKWQNATLIQKRGNIPIQISSQILKPLISRNLGSFAIWGNGAAIVHLLHGFTPTTTCPTKKSNSRWLGYVAFECDAIFQINWESFAHRYWPKKTCLGYVTEVTNVKHAFVDQFHS